MHLIKIDLDGFMNNQSLRPIKLKKILCPKQSYKLIFYLSFIRRTKRENFKFYYYVTLHFRREIEEKKSFFKH